MISGSSRVLRRLTIFISASSLERTYQVLIVAPTPSSANNAELKAVNSDMMLAKSQQKIFSLCVSPSKERRLFL